MRWSLFVLSLFCACPDPTGPIADSSNCDLSPTPDRVLTSDRSLPDASQPLLNHILSTGQSLSIGAGGSPPLSLQQPFQNRMFPEGPLSRSDLSALIPLVERGVETPASGMANLVSYCEPWHTTLISLHGAGASPYRWIKKGTEVYALGLKQVEAGKALAATAGMDYTVRAITLVHGESEHYDSNFNYANDLADWQRDYEVDVQAITGRNIPLPMFHTQISNWTRAGRPTTTSKIPQLQLKASLDSHGKIIMIGPKYVMPYGPDGLHMTNASYRWLGEYYGKVYREVVLKGKAWEPVHPVSVERQGTEIRVRFHVPILPLVFDETLVSNPGNYGFTFSGAQIVSVSLTGPDTVIVKIDKATGGMLEYAMHAPVDALSGPLTGPRGNLRDSDPTASRYDNTLYNWCVHFSEEVP